MPYLLSVIALVAGPFVYAAGQRHPTVKDILDGFVLVAIGGIVCINIIPGALNIGGWFALGALLAGLLFPIVIEKLFRRSMHQAHGAVVLLAAAGLAVHALIDGIALLPGVAHIAEPQNQRTYPGEPGSILGNPLTMGVILHRLPIGMAIWWSVRPHFGTLAAVATFAMLIVATGVSYFWGAAVLDAVEARGLAMFQAFVAGSLVHVVAFGLSHRHDDKTPLLPGGGWGYRAGLLLGLFVVFALPHIH